MYSCICELSFLKHSILSLLTKKKPTKPVTITYKGMQVILVETVRATLRSRRR